MKLVITIDLENDAFAGRHGGREIKRILSDVASLANGCPIDSLDGKTIRDINGNRVGAVEVKGGEA